MQGNEEIDAISNYNYENSQWDMDSSMHDELVRKAFLSGKKRDTLVKDKKKPYLLCFCRKQCKASLMVNKVPPMIQMCKLIYSADWRLTR